MNCPNCEIKMNEITAKSKYGARVFIDQCPQCGGIWFDDMEMYTVDKDVTMMIDKIDADKLMANLILKKELKCPKDNIELTIFQDMNFPAAIKIESCPQCGGFFFNRGEFAAFSAARQKRIAENSQADDKKFTQQIDKLLSSYSSGSTYDVLGGIGKALSKNYYNIPGKGIYSLDKLPETMSDKSDIASAIIFIITQLLRLFIKSR